MAFTGSQVGVVTISQGLDPKEPELCGIHWCRWFPWVRWKMVDLKWKSLFRWMIWGYHHFRKHPYTCKGFPSASFNKTQTFEKKHINTSSLKCYNFINLTQHPQKKTVIYPVLASLKTILVFSSPQSKPTRTCSSNSKQRLCLFSNGKITPRKKTKNGRFLRFETRLLLLLLVASVSFRVLVRMTYV